MQEDRTRTLAAGADAPPEIGTLIVGHLDGVTVLTLLGEHDMSTADDLAVTIRQHAALGRGIVVVLSETDFIDSQVVHELFLGDRQMIREGRRLVIHRDPDSTVENVLQMSGVLARLLCSDTLDEAVLLATQCYQEH